MGPSINVSASNNEEFNPLTVQKPADVQDASIANKDAQLTGEGSVSKSPSNILDKVDQVLEDEEVARSTSRISLGSKASKNSKSSQASKKSLVGRTSSKLSIGSSISKRLVSNSKSMERGGSRISVGSKGSKGSRLSKKLGLTSSKLSVSSKTSKKSLTTLDTTTPAVIQMDPNLHDSVISPLNMQQAEDAVDDIAADGGNSIAKGDESNCGWVGVSCQDRFTCFNYDATQSFAAEERAIDGAELTPQDETNNVQPALDGEEPTPEGEPDKVHSTPEDEPEPDQANNEEGIDVVAEEALDDEPKESLKDEIVTELPIGEQEGPLTDAPEVKDVVEEEEMKISDTMEDHKEEEINIQAITKIYITKAVKSKKVKKA